MQRSCCQALRQLRPAYTCRNLSTSSRILQQATEIPTSPTQETKGSLDYYVGRTPKGRNLGLYEERKRGGNYRQTVLKNLDGNIQKLKGELKEVMGLDEDHIRCDLVTKKIIVKGHRAQEIKTILEGKGF